MINKKLIQAFSCLLTCLSLHTSASELEIGAGVFTATLPKYIGSNEQENYILPLPYFYYKSDKVQIDRNAFTGFLWHDKNWYLDISLSGNIPVKSDEVSIRQNMPDIDFVGEIGPAIKYYFSGTPQTEEQLSIAFNTRKAVALDFSNIASVGWHYSTSVHYKKTLQPLYHGELKLSTVLNINAADDKFLNYYYGVASQYQTDFRPSYQASSGYSGSSLSVGLTWRTPKVWIGSFIKYNNIQGSKQQHSPLVNTHNNWSFGVGGAWVFYSKK